MRIPQVKTATFPRGEEGSSANVLGHVLSASWCLLLLTVLAGCQQGVYSASCLPPELAAPSVVSLQSFELPQLGPAAANSDIIYPRDVLQVTANSGDEEGSPPAWELIVAEDGSITVPLVGRVHVAGLSQTAAGNAIREASIHRQIYRKPTIAVAFKERALNRVTVVGAVEKPDTYQLHAGSSTLSAALAAAGGLSGNASPIVEIQTPYGRQRAGLDATGVAQAGYTPSADDAYSVANPSLVRLNLLDASADSGSTTSMNRYLHDGAVVAVMKKPERYITVMGLTGNKTMPLPPNREMRLLDALAEAGGPKHSIWIADKVKVIRQVPGSNETITIKASIRRAKEDSEEDVLLAAGDIVSVEENAVTFTIDTISKIMGVGVSAAQTARFGYY